MTELAERVEAFALRCSPDVIYESVIDNVQFTAVDVGHTVGDPEAPRQVGVLIVGEDGPVLHLLNPWSRSQVLSAVGTREKWFNTVTRVQEAEELNLRRSTLRRHRFRAVSTSYPDLRILRGIVSTSYGDIPNSDVMKILVEILPKGYALRHLSTLTDRALYVHAVHDTPIGLPDAPPIGFPGVVVKNSEVGYTSLWVIPALYTTESLLPMVFEKKAVLRRTHRGTIPAMKAEFEEAMAKVSTVWQDAAARANTLAANVYATEDSAVDRLREVIEKAGGSKMLALNAERKYRAKGHQRHDGRGLLAALLAAVDRVDADDAYTESAIAGAVLWALTS